jgi:transcriptional regulator with XRE-family HTH domain
LDVTQRQLARECGAHANAVGYWESGKRTPSVLNLVYAARTLGTPMQDLFDVVDEIGEVVKLRRVHL